MLVESGVEVHEIGEETACCHLASKLVQVIVAVFRLVAHTALRLPYLDGEYRRSAVAHTLVGGIEQFSDDTAPLSRGVGTVID